MPDVVKHAWTHRPRRLGGTDPVEIQAGPESAWALSIPASVSHAGHTALEFNELWKSPGSAYTAHGGNEAAYTYIDLNADGWYQADFTVYMSTNSFDPGDFPFLESSCQIAGSPDALQSAVYPTWNAEQDWIGSSMSSTDDYLHRQLVATVWFNYVAADVDPDFGIGVNLESSGSEALTVGGWVAVTRLGDALEQVV